VQKKENDGEIQMWERGEKRYWTGGEERGAECAMKRERQLSTCGIDVAEWERGRETNGEKYGMKTEGWWDGWKRYGKKRRDRMEKERSGDRKKNVGFFNCWK
jgi:hypothetical protein